MVGEGPPEAIERLGPHWSQEDVGTHGPFYSLVATGSPGDTKRDVAKCCNSGHLRPIADAPLGEMEYSEQGLEEGAFVCQLLQ
ncbi:hypothetical protein EBH_0005110 [Eimeria brunetti]|uniref:Uncharacterized protein n=1 Tax=Eimeria brunetti TaxID=51314 RepID=U6LU85_9EIME|nr:hypothetical protein EBH_0005110 [Eimeria brunetti]